MELEELQKAWKELNERVSQNELVHQQQIIEMLSRQKEVGLSGNFWLVSFKISYLCLPLFHETRTTPSCHPSGCAYRQL